MIFGEYSLNLEDYNNLKTKNKLKQEKKLSTELLTV